MSAPSHWPEPAWIAACPYSEREGARLRFYIALAGLYANPQGSLTKMSTEMGLNTHAVANARSRQVMGSDMAVRIEKLLGRELFPWEMFLPELVLKLEG